MNLHHLFLAATLDPNLSKVVVLGVIVIGLGVLLRILRQPYVIAYILAGVLLGEDGFGIITDKALVANLGEFGLILLLFFIGMEINLFDLLRNWRLPVLGTLVQVAASVGVIWGIGYFLDWPLAHIVVIGFTISLSSSAVIIKLLQDNGQSHSMVGQNVIGILLAQDILIVPMLIITNYLGGQAPGWDEVARQVVGGTLIIGIILWILHKQHIRLPFEKAIEEDRELQVFAAFIICFGFALFTAFCGLSAALGAFVAGIVVHAARSTEWFHDSLHAFRVVFVAIFFISVGMLIDLNFLWENAGVLALVILGVFLTNHFINAGILRAFGCSWGGSYYGGALLAQVGELSFILLATASHWGIILDYTYQLGIAVISLTLLISPFWIGITRRLGR